MFANVTLVEKYVIINFEISCVQVFQQPGLCETNGGIFEVFGDKILNKTNFLFKNRLLWLLLLL